MKYREFIVSISVATLIAVPVSEASAHRSKHGNHEPILTQPIANVENNYWFDYLSDIREAEHELTKDLRRATDEEDRRDAYEEYRNEIADANKDYRKEMRERGYRVGRVTVGN
ncbi:hypothetical protein [Parasphingorhabdus halotolerans]|uniref:Uncharacterized protein n=1 Tax=Parasphingorhabdus halotolerans TaxID=2725558 RepID=A0A6H2DQH7_9SPHN|nr:hypothetical protein [Parasphingorhabdus halotolerans]QJB70387.1 hypothetical protein HF685_14860 [Parasphingorhabdus halotolerans]